MSSPHSLQRFKMSAAGLVAAGQAVVSEHRLPLKTHGYL